jgi:hypothetical protein
MTEKSVWHIVKEATKIIGVVKVSPHDLRRYALGCAMPREVSWSKFNFCSGTSRSRPPNDIWAASSGFDRPSMIVSVSNRILESAVLWKVCPRSDNLTGPPVGIEQYGNSRDILGKN